MIEQVINAAGNVDMLSQAAGQQRCVQHIHGSNRTELESIDSVAKLPVHTEKELASKQRLRCGKLYQIPGRIAQETAAVRIFRLLEAVAGSSFEASR